jgi:hypothetical protein
MVVTRPLRSIKRVNKDLHQHDQPYTRTVFGHTTRSGMGTMGPPRGLLKSYTNVINATQKLFWDRSPAMALVGSKHFFLLGNCCIKDTNYCINEIFKFLIFSIM